MTPPPTRRPARSNANGSSPGRSGLSADLLANLSAPGALPTATAPSAASTPPPTRTGGTPALSVTVTPLSWRLPALQAPERGTGVAVRVGPVRVEVAF
jgi:hypothetical protein